MRSTSISVEHQGCLSTVVCLCGFYMRPYLPLCPSFRGRQRRIAYPRFSFQPTDSILLTHTEVTQWLASAIGLVVLRGFEPTVIRVKGEYPRPD